MVSESPTSELAEPHSKSPEKTDVEKEAYAFDRSGPEHLDHHVVADRLARKLSARQVQMIAIGITLAHVPPHYRS